MSQWTHVNASIRVDTIRFKGDEKDILIKELGRMETYDDIREEAEKMFLKGFGYKNTKSKVKLPKGSEGSLRYTVWENPSDSSIAAYTISIFGDLRDYDNEKEIIKFMNKFVKHKMIRSGIVEIDVEGLTTVIYQYQYDKKKFVLVHSEKEEYEK